MIVQRRAGGKAVQRRGEDDDGGRLGGRHATTTSSIPHSKGPGDSIRPRRRDNTQNLNHRRHDNREHQRLGRRDGTGDNGGGDVVDMAAENIHRRIHLAVYRALPLQ